MNGAILRSRVEHVASLVDFDLNDGVGLVEVEKRGHEIVKLGVRQVDLFRLRAEPTRLILVEELVETAVLGAHEHAPGRFGRTHHVHGDVVGGYRVDGLRREAHLVDHGSVAFREPYEIDREQDHLAARRQTQPVLDRLVKCTWLCVRVRFCGIRVEKVQNQRLNNKLKSSNLALGRIVPQLE